MPAILQETNVQIDERLTWLYEEIHKLDEIDRSLTLLLRDGFSYKEMATIVGIGALSLLSFRESGQSIGLSLGLLTFLAIIITPEAGNTVFIQRKNVNWKRC